MCIKYICAVGIVCVCVCCICICACLFSSKTDCRRWYISNSFHCPPHQKHKIQMSLSFSSRINNLSCPCRSHSNNIKRLRPIFISTLLRSSHLKTDLLQLTPGWPFSEAHQTSTTDLEWSRMVFNTPNFSLPVALRMRFKALKLKSTIWSNSFLPLSNDQVNDVISPSKESLRWHLFRLLNIVLFFHV